MGFVAYRLERQYFSHIRQIGLKAVIGMLQYLRQVKPLCGMNGLF